MGGFGSFLSENNDFYSIIKVCRDMGDLILVLHGPKIEFWSELELRRLGSRLGLTHTRRKLLLFSKNIHYP